MPTQEECLAAAARILLPAMARVERERLEAAQAEAAQAA